MVRLFLFINYSRSLSKVTCLPYWQVDRKSLRRRSQSCKYNVCRSFFVLILMHFVYILYSETYNKYYIGETSNLPNRLEYHNYLSDVSFTSKYRPWSVFWTIQVDNRSTGMRIEAYLKKKNRDFIRRLKMDHDLTTWILTKFNKN